jgi:CRISPR-associated endonuclease Cas1
MAASHTLPQPFGIPQISKLGVLVLYGYGVRVTMQAGHLQLEDGAGPERRKLRLPRVGHGLKRLVCVAEDGFATFDALKWLADIDASFVMLNRSGKVLFVTGPTASSDARLRRAQALATQSGTALEISRELIFQKLEGQEQVARKKLFNDGVADAIAAIRADLPNATSINHLRLLESQAGASYWLAWRDAPVDFPRSELRRTPEHWRSFGSRTSPLTGSPRLASNPANAILNYLYALLESEARLAAVALGLDPGLGVMHNDLHGRDSLACDLMEPVRPQVDAYLLDWILRTPLKREWFFEMPDGNCRLMLPFTAMLSDTAPQWAQAVAPLAEWVAHALWSGMKKAPSDRIPATRLTQYRKRESRGKGDVPLTNPSLKPQRLCRGCGMAIASERLYCFTCGVDYSRESLIELAKEGRVVSQSPQAQEKRSATKLRHDLARQAWDPASLPAWLSEAAYLERVQPNLLTLTSAAIARALDVSPLYAAEIRAGRRRPHPRHWQALANLAKIDSP